MPVLWRSLNREQHAPIGNIEHTVSGHGGGVDGVLHVDDGQFLHRLAVFQNGVPFFQPEELVDTLKQMQRTFRYCGVYLSVVTTYIGGYMALTWASNDAILGDHRKWRGLDAAFAAARLRTDYYTPAVHRAAFALPKWIERLTTG